MDRDRDGGVRGIPRGGGEAPGDPSTRPFRSGIGDRLMLRECRPSAGCPRGGGDRGDREYRPGIERFGGGDLSE